MYYRYKVHKKEKKGLRKIFIIVLIAVLAYLGYTQRQYLFFWKYTSNKLIRKVDSAALIKDPVKRKEALKSIASVLSAYQQESPVEVTPFLLSGKVYFLLAQEELGEGFTGLFIHERYREINQQARYYLISSITYLKKALAILEGENLPHDYKMILAKSCFYTDFASDPEILSIMNTGEKDIPSWLHKAEDVRFYSVMLVLNNRQDEGITLLSEKGKVNEGVTGVLFQAAAENLAKHYTDAIMHYKNILSVSRDSQVQYITRINLGKIYYNQFLYNESLLQFLTVLESNRDDRTAKLWAGKNYFALGQKDRARALWNEVLSVGKEDAEVQKLLGMH